MFLDIIYRLVFMYECMYVKDTSEKFRHIGNRFHLRTIFKTNHTLRGTVMKTGPVRDVQQAKQCVYSIPCDCGRCYVSQTSRPSEVLIEEHKYNLTQDLVEKSKLVQHAYEEGHKIYRSEEHTSELQSPS
jgi:hypothetical protein